MLFTKESDYAIRVIRALQDGGKKTIKELCELEQIPSAFGYKIWNVFITLVSEMKAKRDVRFTENFLEFSIR